MIEIPNATSSAPTFFQMGLGASYTTAMINQLGNSFAPAAAWCRSKGSSWYLPSLGELYVIHTVDSVVNNALSVHGGDVIQYGRLWSSSEYQDNHAWCDYFYLWGGNCEHINKNTQLRVRAIRMF